MFDEKDLNARIRETKRYRIFATPTCLDYFEARQYPDIPPERRAHVNVCDYCRTMLHTVIRPAAQERSFFGKLFRAVRNFFFGRR